jgi:hypothetical protein
MAGVACYSVTHNGLSPLGPLRPLALNQTTPPVGPFNTASDIVFNPSSTALFIVIKGTPTASGTIYPYPISSGVVSTIPVVSKPEGLLIDFTISFLNSDDKAVIADPAYGASIVTISNNYDVIVDKTIVVTNQSAICWSTYSSRFNTIFLMDAGLPTITFVDPVSGAVEGVVELEAAGAGALDAAVDRSWLYVLRGTNVVSVVSLEGLTHEKKPEVIQSLDLSALGTRQGWSGMAVYPSS